MSSQWGNGGGGASCGLAHLGLDSFAAVGEATGCTVVRVFVGVVQAFASIVVALYLPLADRNGDVDLMLLHAGFSRDNVSQICAENRSASEWDSTSEHMHTLVASFQEFQ